MKYDQLVPNFLERFPEFREKADQEKEEWEPENPEDEPLSTVFFDGVVSPFLIQAMKSENYGDLVQRLFNYFEELAVSQDERIKATLMVSTLESLGNDKTVINRARNLMGPKTKELSHEAEYDLGREPMPEHYFKKYWSTTFGSGANE